MSRSDVDVAGGPVALEPPPTPSPPASATPRALWRDLLAGARAMAPWLVGIVPYGLVIGVNAARADIPAAAGWLTAPLVYSGSAQVATIELLDTVWGDRFVGGSALSSRPAREPEAMTRDRNVSRQSLAAPASDCLESLERQSLPRARGG